MNNPGTSSVFERIAFALERQAQDSARQTVLLETLIEVLSETREDAASLNNEAAAITYIVRTKAATDRLPTRQEVADHLNIHRTTIYKWRRFKKQYERLQFGT